MDRIYQYRTKAPDNFKEKIAKAKQSSFYLIQELGPLAFILREDKIISDKKHTIKYRVSLGERQTCTCGSFQTEKDICLHILWIMLKYYNVSENNEILYQLSLIEREINYLLELRAEKLEKNKKKHITDKDKEKEYERNDNEYYSKVKQREIEDDQICPICQETFNDSPGPVTFCRLSCGNNIHVNCMKMVMEHQLSTSDETMIKCPLCRNNFNTVKNFKKELDDIQNKKKSNKFLKLNQKLNHFGYICHHCSVNPIHGKCHKCTVCKKYYLCDNCFLKGIHSEHSFKGRISKKDSWELSIRYIESTLPEGLIQNLQNRELNEEDYNTLLLLDQKAIQGSIPLHIINSFPTKKIKYIDKDKITCVIYKWLLHTRSTCPVCGLAAYSSIINDDNYDKPDMNSKIYKANVYPELEKPKKKGKNKKSTDILNEHNKNIDTIKENNNKIQEFNLFIHGNSAIKQDNINNVHLPKNEYKKDDIPIPKTIKIKKSNMNLKKFNQLSINNSINEEKFLEINSISTNHGNSTQNSHKNENNDKKSIERNVEESSIKIQPLLSEFLSTSSLVSIEECNIENKKDSKEKNKKIIKKKYKSNKNNKPHHNIDNKLNNKCKKKESFTDGLKLPLMIEVSGNQILK
ncbi:hypothetical protein BCR32DRAFT_269785 [Anaeromyces robustus]|uniref:SWIM-type domain-containing protein n=1 Tax=Anaeromyces robustus TaxID=1754192 RepID=A0A1Y1X0R1_9FUNG|nr:hypothetical protein BCR32DRAFT_269785 [Anaeromyces robustus]|eukprot:ORX78924.1 hypothetical protein BCR32DRAFT_269785 [Anaeromyces robustus]